MPLPIDLTEDGVRLVSDCAEIIVYWRGSVFERIHAIERFYVGAMQGLRPSVKWYETEATGEVQRVHARTFDLLPRWLKAPRSRRGMMGLVLESGSDAASSSNLAFSIFCDEEDPQPMGYMRLVTPSDVLDRDPGLFFKTVLHLIDDSAFESGTAGYAVNWDRRSDFSHLAESHIARVAVTYPGVEIPDPNTTLIAFQRAEQPAFKRVNWVTFLGRELAQRIPPIEFDPRLAVQVVVLGAARILVAGPAPRRSGDLDAYRAVGKALAPWRVTEHTPLFGYDDDKNERWLAAFD